MPDADIDLSECSEITPDMVKHAEVRHGLLPVPPKDMETHRKAHKPA